MKIFVMDQGNIRIKGAKVNNLKNVDVSIPRNKLVVVTGVSGSGKSSLAFDTLYAEGQRRYVESLSAYARQFLGKMAKPEVDFIKGLPPAIAIEQKVNTRNPRSTVGTSTEIYDYLRLLFGRIGRTYSPVTGQLVKKHTIEDVISTAVSYPEGTRIAVAAQLDVPQNRSMRQHLEILMKGGYSRLASFDGNFLDMEQLIADEGTDRLEPDKLLLLIDRLSFSNETDNISRLTDSAETAFFEGHDQMTLLVWNDGAVRTHQFSKRFEADGITFREPSDLMFNFNNPYGACSTCEGFGKVLGIDPALVVPDPTLSVYDDAVKCWRGEKMSEWKRALQHIAPHIGFPIHKPYCELSQHELDLLWHGSGPFGGIDGFFRMVDENQHKIQYRVMRAHYRGKTTCPTCGGSRLKPDTAYVRVNGLSISELTAMPVEELKSWFDNLQLSDTQAAIASRLLTEIKNRLEFLCDVGLGYLTLDRTSNTLSGGESQRINLATSLGSSLMGSLYILDEPSIGLHSRDTDRLIKVLCHLRDIGNTVVIVEHDQDIMQAADHLVDVGPDAGTLGGRIMWEGPLSELPKKSDSYTVNYLKGSLSIPVPKQRRRWRDYIEVAGASEHNLKGIDVKFPLGVLTVVTGVSGSGKSTLVRDILYRAVARHFDTATDAPGRHKCIRGDLQRISGVEFVDQNPIGRSSRSNPATYLKAYDEIRRLFAEQQGSKQMGFTPGHFSFNAEGGRCEECKGEGTITIEMQFMADIVIPCEACHGQRFKNEILEIRYRGKNINDILNMTVNEAIEFFSEGKPEFNEKKIVNRLRPLNDVGLGYIKLGQSSSTLSGGENQRVKLAYYIGQEKSSPTLFIFDEPTTGLHLNDINTLMKSLNRLIEQGHSIVIIEHNLDVIKCADHVIDIGPEGGDKGGKLVVCGTPEMVAGCADSYTGRYLRDKLK
ncbi:excinuclease ABC subunit UvrA [uncultured Muribaculum sp.]|uniref:excinuclease ABC subunit UvrA n=2 Tax=uncultured Muribaculum sp. TaxID=1918613 RepID=UPI00266FA3C5|nr:excinuclease ABC subunit UvrA [uncultured Muribaculum sp.]